MKLIITLILAIITTTASAQYPDGTLVLSSKPGTIIGNVAQRMASRAQGYRSKYTHIGVVIEGRIYHSDYPRVASIAVGAHKRGERADYYAPATPYTPQQVAAMKSYAQSQIGQPYRLRGFRLRNGEEGWCSTFAGQVLNRGGYNIGKSQRFTPDGVLNSVRSRYRFVRSIQR
jgi:hypothetical protein